MPFTGMGRVRVVDDGQHQDEDAHHVGFVLKPLPRLAGSLHGPKGMRWRGLHRCSELRMAAELDYGELRIGLFCLRNP